MSFLSASTPDPVYKIWNSHRTRKKMVLASSLDDLINKGRSKLDLHGELSVVLEADGTEIDDDDVLCAFKGHTLMLLESTEHWTPISDPSTSNSETSESLGSTSTYLVASSSTMQESSSPIMHSVQHEGEQTAVNSDLRAGNVPKWTTNVPLPQFSYRVEKKLKDGDAASVWTCLIQEAAEYYYDLYPDIESRTEYRNIGERMLTRYPSIEHYGTHKWSLFTKCLSQRIRHIRWQKKKSTALSGSGQDSSEASTSRHIATVPQLTPKHISEDDYNKHVHELAEEVDKRNPSESHIRMILTETFKRNQEWIKSLPDGSIAPIMDRLPCYKYREFLLHDFKQVITTQAYTDLAEYVPSFCSSIEVMMGSSTEDDNYKMIPVIQFIEEKTKLGRGRGKKTESILNILNDIPGESVEDHLKSPPLSPPHLVILLQGGLFHQGYIVFDERYTVCNTSSASAALLILLSAYFVFNLEYPRIYSQVLGFLQTFLIRSAPYLGLRSANYLKFARKLQLELTKHNE